MCARVTNIVRRALHGEMMAVGSLIYASLALLAVAILLELASIAYCAAQGRSAGALPVWYPYASAAMERPSGIEHRDSVYYLRSYDLRQWPRMVSGSSLRMLMSVDESGGDYAIREPGYHWLVLGPAR